MNKIICITGKMASGKNYITSQYEKDGWISVDADIIVHQAIETAKNRILDTFSEYAEKYNVSLLNNDNTINRKALGKILFEIPELLKVQESILYPIVTAEIIQFTQDHKDKNIIINATLLYKTPDLMKLCSEIIYVKANLFKRIKRAKKRDNIPLKQILKRFKTQSNLYKEYKKTGIPIKVVLN